jgi:SAM-dependent methyltransferase
MKPEVQQLPLDVEDLMREIRSGLRRDMSRQSADAVHFYPARSLIRETPPTPQTLRGKLGRWAALAIRRLLWWCTQPIKKLAGITDLRAGLAAEMAAREALAGTLTGLIEEYGQLRRHFGEMQNYAEQTRSEAAFNNARVGMFLEEAHRSLPGPLQPEQLQRLARATEHAMDAVYVAFENAFRGTRELVKERQSIYLSYLATAEAGTPDRPILDLGCGRGEWLELLREHQLTGRGIDTNQVMLDMCRGAGLDVVEGDALSFTRALPDASLGAITAFHVVEHLPFDTLAALLDQALRTLKPGGLLILETPNPGNALVGSHHFYLDPTHLRPLPMAMLRFFVESKGFGASQILPLHPNTDGVLPLASDGDLTTQRFNELFYGPRDYAVIARRP